MTEAPYDTLIIGAGMAGLTAARTLAEAGQRVLVVEAQDRIGGRILTRHIHGETVEVGAEFVHGRPPELWALIEEAGLETTERDGTQLCFEAGALSDCSDDRDDIFKVLEGLELLTGPDLSFADYLAQHPVSADQRQQLIGFVEGFNAADHRLASAAALGRQQQAEDETEGDRSFHINGGYSQLPDFLAAKITSAGSTIRRSTPVRAINWQPGQVEAVTDSGILRAKRAIITLPLGILQSNAVPITPTPGNLPTLISKIQMGQVCRFTLIFRERFWADLQPQPAASALSFLFATTEMPPVWWTPHPATSAIITGWVGGPRSTPLLAHTPEALANQACETLARIFSLPDAHLHDLLLACETHNWQTDPYTLGAYSYIGTGGLNAPNEMTEPIANTLYFAGEHTDTTGHWGTVHAAIRSGHRAASQVLC
ncbi:flavin monoamine oxidase family protein [Granulicella arctica]|uniref:flavin monoamine oxidase family protein n=1 Tax=Granulicella arctica TaxID=940613 RepID=UPI0021DF709B|nr:NAD(P)/FAD-dependent oxidoreductase [Granulicella arctica]